MRKLKYAGVNLAQLSLHDYLNNYEMMMHTQHVWRDGHHLIYWLTGHASSSGDSKAPHVLRKKASAYFYKKKSKWGKLPKDVHQRQEAMASTKQHDNAMLNMTHLFNVALERLE